MVRAGKPMEPQSDQSWKATEATEQICKTIGATGWSELESHWSYRVARAGKLSELQSGQSCKAIGATEYRVARAGKLSKLQNRSVKLSELQSGQSWKAIGATEWPELESCRSYRADL